MRDFILVLISMSLVSILLEVLLPTGETKKYVRFFIGIAVSFVIISSIINLYKNIDIVNYSFKNFNVDSNYIAEVEKTQEKIISNGIEEIFRQNEIKAEVSCELNEDEIEKITIYSDASQEKIKLVIKSQISVSPSKIVIIGGK